MTARRTPLPGTALRLSLSRGMRAVSADLYARHRRLLSLGRECAMGFGFLFHMYYHTTSAVCTHGVTAVCRASVTLTGLQHTGRHFSSSISNRLQRAGVVAH